VTTHNKVTGHVRVGAALVALLLSAGCIQLTPRRLAFIPAPQSFRVVECAKEIALRPAIGGEESDIWVQDKLARVSNTDFNYALRVALLAAGYRVHDSVQGDSDYELRAEIIHEQPPIAGLNMSSTLTVRYGLYHPHEREPFWQQSVTTTYEVGLFVDLLGGRRYSRAVEGAARENISEFLRSLGPVVARGV
jgi:hypothetical protein